MRAWFPMPAEPVRIRRVVPVTCSVWAVERWLKGSYVAGRFAHGLFNPHCPKHLHFV